MAGEVQGLACTVAAPWPQLPPLPSNKERGSVVKVGGKSVEVPVSALTDTEGRPSQGLMGILAPKGAPGSFRGSLGEADDRQMDSEMIPAGGHCMSMFCFV